MTIYTPEMAEQHAKLLEDQKTMKIRANALKPIERAGGSFRELDFGNFFDFRIVTPNSWNASKGASHEFYSEGYNRWIGCRIGKTVAYVFIDEDGEGSVIWDRWQIRVAPLYK